MSKSGQIDILLAQITNDGEPQPDIAICYECGWRGSVSKCGRGTEGDFESGYYEIDTCPECDDGGWIGDYDMTPERLAEWEAWDKDKEEDGAHDYRRKR